MVYHAQDLNYDLIRMDNHLCLFTNMRIDRDTIPEGLHCYDVRDGDDCTGIFAEIQSYVLVNHWGTILTKDSIPMNEHHRYWPENENPDFGPPMTLVQFQSTPQEELEQLFLAEIDQLANLQMRAGEIHSPQSPLNLRIQEAQGRVEINPQPLQDKERTDKDH